MARKAQKEKQADAHIQSVAFYDEWPKVEEAAAKRRMKKSAFVREVVRKFLGLPSGLDQQESG